MKLIDKVISPGEEGKTLAEILKEYGLNPDSQNIQVWIDGKYSQVPPEKLKLKAGWKIEIAPIPAGSDVGQAIGAIAVGLMVGIATAGLAVALGAASTLIIGTAFAVGYTVGSGVFRYLTTPKPTTPTFNTSSGSMESSPTYSWNGIQTISGAGNSIPVIYGVHATGGIRIAYDMLQTTAVGTSKIDTDNDSVLDTLLLSRKTYDGQPVGKFAQPLQDYLLLCEGEIESIEEVTINDLPVRTLPVYKMWSTKGTHTNTEFISIVPPEYQLNAPPDTSVPTQICSGLNTVLSHDEPFQYITQLPSKMISGLYININFPTGLYKIDDSGNIQREPCKFKIRLYRGDTLIGETEEIQIEGNVKEGFVARYFIYIYKTPATVDNSPVGVCWAFIDTESNDEPYRLEIQKTSEDSPTTYDVNTSYIQSILEVTPYRVHFPYTAYLSYFLSASPALSGTLPNVRVTVKGKKIWTWNEETESWEQKWTDNPAWIIRDILTNPRYGLGDFITEENIDNESFKAFAKFCEEQGYRCNLVLDGFQKGWDLVNNLLSKFRAFILRSGSKYKIKFLKDEPPVQMFTMGNIIQETLTVHFISASDRYNTIEARFLDESDSYRMKTILVSTGEKYERKKTIDFFGITDRATVEKECRFLLNWMQKVKRSIEFEAYLDAIAIEPGDIFLFSHDVPRWLASGRIEKQEDKTLILDREIDPETSYIKVRTKDDQILTFEVEKAEGNSVTLKDEIPDLSGSPYIAGKIEETPKLYRCTEITRTAENIRHIVAVEHLPELFE